MENAVSDYAEHLRKLLSIYESEEATVNADHAYHLCFLISRQFSCAHFRESVSAATNDENLLYYSHQLKFFSKLLSDYPQILDVSKTSINDASIDHSDYLCLWLVVRLATAVLGPRSTPLFADTLDTCKAIVKTQGQQATTGIVIGLIDELTKLQALNERCDFAVSCQYSFERDFLPLTVRPSVPGSELVMNTISITIDTFLLCEVVQTLFSALLCETYDCLHFLYGSQLLSLWTTALDQVKIGGCDLKKVSFRLVAVLLQQELVLPAICRVLVDECLTFVECLLQDDEGRPPDVQLGDAEELVSNLGEVLVCCSAVSVEFPASSVATRLFAQATLDDVFQWIVRTAQVLLHVRFMSLPERLVAWLLQLFAAFVYYGRLFGEDLGLVRQQTLGDIFIRILYRFMMLPNVDESCFSALFGIVVLCLRADDKHAVGREATFGVDLIDSCVKKAIANFASLPEVRNAFCICYLLTKALFDFHLTEYEKSTSLALEECKARLVGSLFVEGSHQGIAAGLRTAANSTTAGELRDVYSFAVKMAAIVLSRYKAKPSARHSVGRVREFGVALLSLLFLNDEQCRSEFHCISLIECGSLYFRFEASDATALQLACLRSLAALGEDIGFVQWRTNTFLCCLNGGDRSLVRECVDLLPSVLTNLTKHRTSFWQQVTTTFFQSDAAKDVYPELLAVIHRCICVLAGTCESASCTTTGQRMLCSCSMPTTGPVLAESGTVRYLLKNMDFSTECCKIDLCKCLLSVFLHCKLEADEVMECIDKSAFLAVDSSPEVREMFSRCIGVVAQSCEADQQMITHLKSFVSSLQRASQPVEASNESMLLCLGEMSKSLNGDVFDYAFVRLTIFALARPVDDELFERACALTKEIARGRQRSLRSLFDEYARSITKYVTRLLCDLVKGSPVDIQHHVVFVFRKMARLFGMTSAPDPGQSEVNTDSAVATALRNALPTFVPWLAVDRSAAASTVLTSVAQLLKTNRHCLLAANFRYVLLQVTLLQLDAEETKAVFEFVESEGQADRKWTISTYLSWDLYSCIYELLLHLAEAEQRVTDMLLCVISNFDRSEQHPEPKGSTDALITSFIRPRLPGVLIKFDEKFRTNAASSSAKERMIALRSLIRLMEMCKGQILDDVRVKVLSTLRSASLQAQDPVATVAFRKLCGEAWSTYVSNLSNTALKDVFLLVIVSIVPFVDVDFDCIKGVFDFLFLTQRRSLSAELREIAFVLSSDEHSPLKPYFDQFSALLIGVRESFLVCLRLVEQENADLKRMALRRLKALTDANQLFLHQAMLDAEVIDPMVIDMCRTLMACFQNSDADVKLLAAACFGSLGAVDPGRLTLSHDSRQPFECTALAFADFDCDFNSEFARLIIADLTKYLMGASDGFFYDICSCVIQETLRFFRCDKEKDIAETTACIIWNGLPDNVRSVITPLLSTCYHLRKTPRREITEQPLYGSVQGNNLKQWLFNWLTFLVSKIRHKSACQIYQLLSVLVEYEVNFAYTILPHVVFQKLIEGDKKDIVAETLAVLTSSDCSSDSGGSGFWNAACQVIFGVLDFLQKWIYKVHLWPDKKEHLKRVESFMQQIPRSTIADCAFHCQAFSRALMYYELFISEQPPECLLSALGFLQKIYASLNDFDSILGAVAVREQFGQPSPSESILSLEAAGAYVEALPFYEMICEARSDTVTGFLGLSECLLKLNQPAVCRRYIEGVLKENSSWSDDLHQCYVEALCKLQDWEGLKREVENHETCFRWCSDVSHLLLQVQSKDRAGFEQSVVDVRKKIVKDISVAMLDSNAYDAAYQYILRLHILHEVEKSCGRFLALSKPPDDVEHFCYASTKEWDNRLKIVQTSTDVQNHVLDIRRLMLYLLPECAAKTDILNASWLKSAKISRKAGHLQPAWNYLVKVDPSFVPRFIEEAKYLWRKNEREESISRLNRGIASHFANFIDRPNEKRFSETSKEKFYFAKAQLLFANFAHESASRETYQIIEMYRKLLAVCPDSEKAYFYAAYQLDQVAHSSNFRYSYHSLLLQIVSFYGKSLKYGTRFLHHSMPRLLTLWLDNTARFYEKLETSKQSPTNESSQKREETITSLNGIMQQLFETLPPYLFYTSFSQLISRICHPVEGTATILKSIIAKVIATFPQQGLWMSMSVSRSVVPPRKRACQDILAMAESENSAVAKLRKDMERFIELLLQLCAYTPQSRTVTLCMSRDFPKLYNFFLGERRSRALSRIMLPMQSSMDLNIPVLKSGCSPDANRNPFPTEPVYIEGFTDQIVVLNSLQKPKKITLRGSDGRIYSVMCKSKDDLRLDKRLMEFNGLVNICLLRNAEARKRQLCIRTYTVVPLSEDCGLVEWVSNLEGVRHILMKIYKERGSVMTMKELQNTAPRKSDPLSKKLKIFEDVLLKRHPAVLSFWFRSSFPDPSAWYRARLNYIRTGAVMCMVGFVLGLGDRHGENILIDSVTGEVVHVDFNCLFNKGEDLDWPELVPFRLTHNMVEAMGPLGYEGPFRKCCEVTMRVMREQKSMLRSALETFLHDPLVEWTRNSTKPRPTAGEEKAKEHLLNIDTRLKGCVKAKVDAPYGLPLNVEGQVNHLIQQATDNKLLCQMYIGWAGYM